MRLGFPEEAADLFEAQRRATVLAGLLSGRLYPLCHGPSRRR